FGRLSEVVTVVNLDIATLDPTQCLQSLPESVKPLFGLGDRACEHANSPQPLNLLCARRNRVRGGRAAEQRYELAPVHSITSSAIASTAPGSSRPSAFAALRLMTNSSLFGCTTGRSAGFSPLRMRPT